MRRRKEPMQEQNRVNEHKDRNTQRQETEAETEREIRRGSNQEDGNFLK